MLGVLVLRIRIEGLTNMTHTERFRQGNQIQRSCYVTSFANRMRDKEGKWKCKHHKKTIINDRKLWRSTMVHGTHRKKNMFWKGMLKKNKLSFTWRKRMISVPITTYFLSNWPKLSRLLAVSVSPFVSQYVFMCVKFSKFSFLILRFGCSNCIFLRKIIFEMYLHSVMLAQAHSIWKCHFIRLGSVGSLITEIYLRWFLSNEIQCLGGLYTRCVIFTLTKFQ